MKELYLKYVLIFYSVIYNYRFQSYSTERMKGGSIILANGFISLTISVLIKLPLGLIDKINDTYYSEYTYFVMVGLYVSSSILIPSKILGKFEKKDLIGYRKFFPLAVGVPILLHYLINKVIL
ncbi:hypothetical protein EI427_17330 [Flammeovirga pectinis]|uniref:Uncharacterized protein n=1 Tax=Flammeovirga pectinis TaxID=2494373 RepID=A0A3Q9FP23_9BACT|nr:hypothetical protein [Flammeovirga pectinis]AZQ63923.1 hypothetical protein EI427_17330 [Flammeovirga pectinis]